MKRLRIQIRKWLRRYNRMPRRERVLILATVAVAYIGLTYQGHQGLEALQAALNEQIVMEGIQLKAAEVELREKEAQAALDPEAARRELMARLVRDEQNAEAELTSLTRHIIKPEQMTQVVKGILAGDPTLRVLAFENLPPESFLRDEPAGPTPAEANAAPAPKPETLLYKHGLRLRVEGQYLDLIGYLRALEGLPWRLFWSEAELEVPDAPLSTTAAAPRAVLTLSVYTLSLDQKWAKGA